MAEGDFLVKMKHLRAAGNCNRESRIWCVERQGWSWTEFVTKGLPASLFYATGDPQAAKVADIARDDPDRENL